MLSYHRFDPGPCEFPKPRVPVLPTLTREQVARPVAGHAGPEVRRYARGRYALQAAYAMAGVGERGALLAPAYHCRTMLDGALRLRAQVVLYRLNARLEPELADLDRAYAACATRPAALLFTHYFGMPGRIAPVADWCRAHDVVLIEDCSHALVLGNAEAADGDAAGQRMGRTGRYAVSSPYKFHPCPDGGVLWSPRGAPLPPALSRPGWRTQLGGLRQAMRQIGARPVAPAVAALRTELATLGPWTGPCGREWVEEAPATPWSSEYRPDDEAVRSLAVSQWIERRSDTARLLQRRRGRYAQWSSAIAELSGCRALFPVAAPSSTPYMFALHVDDPARRFFLLKRLGVPLWRWDDMAVSECTVSQRYRQGVFHLPCHQALTDTQMEWMIAAVGDVMRR